VPGEEGAPAFVRTCDSRVGFARIAPTDGDLNLDNLRLYAADQHSSVANREVFARGRRQGGRWRAFKTLVLLNGSEATLSVLPHDRDAFLLAYDPSHVRNFAYARQDGQAEVRFVNCERPRPDLEFPGALLARKPGCFHLQAVSQDGTVLASGVVNIAMGRGACRNE